MIGLFGLVGAAGRWPLHVPGIWRQGKAGLTTTVGLVLLLLSWIPIAFAKQSLWALIAGILILDLAVQAVHVTNQSVMYRIMPDAQPPDRRLHDQLLYRRRPRLTALRLGLSACRLVRRGRRRRVLCLLNLLTWWLGKHHDPQGPATI